MKRRELRVGQVYAYRGLSEDYQPIPAVVLAAEPWTDLGLPPLARPESGGWHVACAVADPAAKLEGPETQWAPKCVTLPQLTGPWPPPANRRARATGEQ